MNIRRVAWTATALLTSAGVAAGASLDVEAAHGAGLASWWAAHGKTAVVAAACLLEGYAASALFVSGTEIDWQESMMGAAFSFKNPNAKGTCGCGTSFTA